jgi:hypothetical protein
MLGHIENELAQLASRVENLERSANRNAGVVNLGGKHIAVPPGSYVPRQDFEDLKDIVFNMVRVVKYQQRTIEELSVGQDALLEDAG